MTKNNLKSYALIIIATVILALISMLPLGLIGILFSALLSATIGYTVTKHHYLFAGVVCACVLFIYTAFSKDFSSALFFALPLILSGITLGITCNIKASEFTAIGVITGIYTLYILLTVKVSGLSGSEYFAGIFSDSFKSYAKTLNTLYPDQFSVAQIETMLGDALALMIKLMPSFIVMMCAILALFMFYMFKKVLKTTKCDVSHFKPFSEWRADKSFSIVFLLIAFISFTLPGENYFADALSNVVLVSVFVFYIFGLSLADFLLAGKIKSKFTRRIILLLMITFLSGLPMLILFFSGVLDGIIDIRSKVTKNNLPKQE